MKRRYSSTTSWRPQNGTLSLTYHLYIHAHRDIIQGGHERTAQQLPIYRPEGIHHQLRQPMGRPRKNIIRLYCQETEGSNIARC